MPYDLRYIEDDAIEVGIDEAGRGALFGRLYVGAVVFPSDLDCFFDHGAAINEIKDSKKISERKRDILYDYVKECAVDSSVAWASNEEVDALNVLQADLVTMHKALDSLIVPVQRILVDGDAWKTWPSNPSVEVHKIVQGDSKFIAIAGASILAKVARDRWVNSVCDEHPEWDEMYGLRSNKGYGAAKHMAAIKSNGPTPLHRMSFAPCNQTKKSTVQQQQQVWIGTA
jgi:ribonuclease HII